MLFCFSAMKHYYETQVSGFIVDTSVKYVLKQIYSNHRIV